jgi:flagellar protein FlbD
MILLHRLRGESLVVDADLIETVEPVPDTVITQIDGHKLVVRESTSEVAALFILRRAAVLASVDLTD